MPILPVGGRKDCPTCRVAKTVGLDDEERVPYPWEKTQRTPEVAEAQRLSRLRQAEEARKA
jgi:hypothetical protein